MRRTNQDLPFSVSSSSDLVGGAHLGVGHTADHEDDEPRAGTILRWRLVLVPLSEPRTADSRLHGVDGGRLRDEWPLLPVQLVLYGILHHVFDGGCPSGELVRALLALFLLRQCFPSIESPSDDGAAQVL